MNARLILFPLLCLLAAPLLAAVRIEGARIGEVPPSSTTAAAWMTLVNDGPRAVVLRRISSPAADEVMWHEVHHGGGMSHMMMRSEVILPARSRTVLAPGQAHVMLMGLRGPLRVRQRVVIDFQFAGQRPLRVEAPVQPLQP